IPRFCKPTKAAKQSPSFQNSKESICQKLRSVVLRFVTDESRGVAHIQNPFAVIRGAEEDPERNLGANGLYNQLREIARTAPFALHLMIGNAQERIVISAEVANANADHRHAVSIRVMPRERFAE